MTSAMSFPNPACDASCEATPRLSADDRLRIADIVFDSFDGIMISDRDRRIVSVNNAFTRITGFSAADVVGQPMATLRSGWHDDAFYQAIWTEIDQRRAWQGEIYNRRKTGEIYREWISITALADEEDRITHYVSVFSDITLRQAADDKVAHLLFFDALTRLPNRRSLCDRIVTEQEANLRYLTQGALLLIDLDDFKRLNETSGFAHGDLLLQQVADRLTACLRPCDMVARLGGDEFVVMLVDLPASQASAAAEAEMVGKKILATLGTPFDLGNYTYGLTASMGVILFTGPAESAGDLIKGAEVAMYQAKQEGRGRLKFYLPEMQQALVFQMTLDVDLRAGLHLEQFFLVYQAQVDRDGRLVGAEALVRWRHPQRGIVSPAIFIPRAEENGLIVPLGQWVLREACRQLARWAKQGSKTDFLTLAVNVSSRQFRQPDFVDQVIMTLEETGADPRRLKLELTESMLADNVETVIEKMSALREIGVHFSLDDFGTGYSSLAYLKRLPLSQLKIDQCFVADLLVDSNDAAIVQSIIGLGRSFGLAVIAEGVETVDQREYLAKSGCAAFQGYLYGKPGSADALLLI
jgi:diguanylate cyclase (GGDEF)-like protein/PAS domain S-box-containing protein